MGVAMRYGVDEWSGTADLNIRGVAWAIDTSALDLQVDYSVGLVSVEAQGAVPG